MELTNELYAVEARVARAPSPVEVEGTAAATNSPGQPVPVSLLREVQRTLALLLAPFAPYLAHELWEMLGEKGSLLRTPWPKYDPVLAKEEEIEIPVQINGKLRSRMWWRQMHQKMWSESGPWPTRKSRRRSPASRL